MAWMSLPRSARLLITVVLAGGAMSVAASGSTHLGSLEVALVAQLVMLVLMVSSTVRENRQQTDKLLTVAIFAGAMLCILKFWVIYVMYALEGKIFSWDSPFLEFANVRFFSQYQSYALLLLILPGLMPGLGRFARTLLFLVAANFWALHWMVGTRAAWIGLLAAATVVLVFARRDRMIWLRRQALVALAGGAIFVLNSHIATSLPDIAPTPRHPVHCRSRPGQHQRKAGSRTQCHAVHRGASAVWRRTRTIRPAALLHVRRASARRSPAIAFRIRPAGRACRHCADSDALGACSEIPEERTAGRHARRQSRRRLDDGSCRFPFQRQPDHAA